jgi:flavodoxin
MKILVVYYSKTGNTKRLASDIATGLGADLEEIIDKKDRKGAINWILSGRDAMKKLPTEIGDFKDPQNYDLVVVGTPVWAWTMVPAVRTYLNLTKDNIAKLVCLVTADSSNTQKVVADIEEVVGKKSVASLGLIAKDLKDTELYNKKVSDFIADVKKLEMV